MAEITAAMVKELREKTDAPMMECKKALAEAGGDLAKAEEILRVKLGNKASKAATRIAAEGVVAVHIDGKVGAIIEVNSETDFVAKNDDFLKFAKDLAVLVARSNPADVAALSDLPLAGGTVESVRTALVGKIGENMAIRRFARVAAAGTLASYVHGGSKIGVLLDITGADADLAKDVAMHIAASKPGRLMQAACRQTCSMPSGASRSKRHVRPASRRRCSRRSPRHGAEVPEGSHAAGPGLRQGRGRQADDRAAVEREERKSEPVRALRRRRGHREEAERLRRRGRCAGGRGAGLRRQGSDDRILDDSRLPTRPAEAVGRGPDGRRCLRINRQTVEAMVADIGEVVQLGSRSPSSSAVAISSAVLRWAPAAWTVPRPTTWE